MPDQQPPKKKKKKPGFDFSTVLIILCELVAAFSIIMIASILIRGKAEERTFNELSSLIAEPAVDGASDEGTLIVRQDTDSLPVAAEADTTLSPETPAEPDLSNPNLILTEYADVYQMNRDLFGWLKIDGTPIDYPVMFTPNEPEYYLRRDFYKRDSQGGTPFLDGSWTDQMEHYLIYGHNMNNGSMFAGLKEYDKREFWEEHKTIRFDTLKEHGEYEVMAVFYTHILADDEPGFRYYDYLDLSDPLTFEDYVRQVKAGALYDTGVIASRGDTLITLSTCSYHTTDGRLVLVGRKIED